MGFRREAILTLGTALLVLVGGSAAARVACAVDELDLAAPDDVGMRADRLGEVDALTQRLIDQKRIAGAVVIVARHGKVVHFAAHGWQDVAQRKRMRRNTIFRIYSMTKAVVSVATMVLVEDGKLDLDAPVWRYVPAVKQMRIGDREQGQPMTVRDLLRHTAGFSNNVTVDRALRDRGHPSLAASSLQDICARLGDVPLRYQPGLDWHYSFGTEVLARVLEVVSGKPLDRCVEELVLKPLDMRDTHFYVPVKKRSRLAEVYGRNLRVTPAPQPGTSGPFDFTRTPKFLSAGADWFPRRGTTCGFASCCPHAGSTLARRSSSRKRSMP